MILGELSPMQESKLVQLKSRVSELLKGKVPSDPVFLRFLRARDFNVDKVYMKNQMIHLITQQSKVHNKQVSMENMSVKCVTRSILIRKV